MIWSLIGSIGGKVLDIVVDKDEANRPKLKAHSFNATGDSY